MIMVLVLSGRGEVRMPRYVKFAEPPERRTREVQAYWLPLRSSNTLAAIGSSDAIADICKARDRSMNEKSAGSKTKRNKEG
jgi:hypothetical protein